MQSETKFAQMLMRLAVATAVLALLGLAIDGALLFFEYRLGQATLAGAARAAALAVDEEMSRVVGSAQLRLAPSADGQPTAYDLAQDYVDARGRGRVWIADLVFDGQRVLVRGGVATPTVFLRWLGVPDFELELLATAEVFWAP